MWHSLGRLQAFLYWFAVINSIFPSAVGSVTTLYQKVGDRVLHNTQCESTKGGCYPLVSALYSLRTNFFSLSVSYSTNPWRSLMFKLLKWEIGGKPIPEIIEPHFKFVSYICGSYSMVIIVRVICWGTAVSGRDWHIENLIEDHLNSPGRLPIRLSKCNSLYVATIILKTTLTQMI